MEQDSHVIFVGNMKGGVGKSTLSCYIADYLDKRMRMHEVSVLDTDAQGSSVEMLTPVMRDGQVKHLPIGGSYDGVNLLSADTHVRTKLSADNQILLIDSGAGKPETIMQLAAMAKCVLVPVSVSWTEIRPTQDYIEEIQFFKESNGSNSPHVIVVPNRLPPQQRDFSLLHDAMQELDVIVAPGLSDLSIVRKQSVHFGGLAATRGTRFYTELCALGDFIVDYVLSGKIDSYYDEEARQGGDNIIELHQ